MWYLYFYVFLSFLYMWKHEIKTFLLGYNIFIQSSKNNDSPVNTYTVRFVQKISSHILWKIETFIEKYTRYKKHCIQDNDASAPFKVGTLGPHTVLPIAISYFIVFSWISLKVWNLFPFKSDFTFGKSLMSHDKSELLGG